MKLFSSNIFARFESSNITFSPFVIAESKNEALSKINEYIKVHPILSQSQVKSVVVIEEMIIE